MSKGYLTGAVSFAAREFFAWCMTQPGDTKFEVGMSWTIEDGWRPYMRYGEKALTMAPKMAERLAKDMLRKLRLPENKGADADGFLKEAMGDLVKIAAEARDKQRRKEIPDGAAGALPIMGRS